MSDPVARLNAALEGRYTIEASSVKAAWQPSTWRTTSSATARSRSRS